MKHDGTRPNLLGHADRQQMLALIMETAKHFSLQSPFDLYCRCSTDLSPWNIPVLV
jgi:hypothetical protein